MKKITLLLLLFVSNIASAQIGYNIVNSFPAPTGNVGDLTYDGTYLWLGSHFENGSIYQISPTNGTVIKVINTDIMAVGGLTFGDGTLWVAENNASFGKKIIEVDTISGQTLSTIYHNLGDFTHGMEYHNDNIYVNMFYSMTTDTTFVMDANGGILDKNPIQFNYSHGIAFDGCSFWITSNENNPTVAAIHEVDTSNFNVISSDGIVGGNFPNGLAWDGNYLWIANAESDSLYQIDLSVCPTLSISAENELNSIEIWPNPTSRQLNIASDLTVFEEAEILDNSGQSIKSLRIDANQIDVSSLASGIYFIRLRKEAKSVTKKFIKN